jgi:hypothetical protein
MILDLEPEDQTLCGLPDKHNKTLKKSTGGAENNKAEEETQVERLAIKLQNTTKPTVLLDKILDQTIPEITIREIISCSEAVCKLMFRNVRNYSTKPEVRVNSIRMSSDEMYNYMATTLKVKVSLDGSRAVQAILDSGAEVNVITQNLTDKLGLLVRPDVNLVIVVYTGD